MIETTPESGASGVDIVKEHEKINYVEFPAGDLEAIKEFFSRVFGWSFTGYGPEHTAFSDEGLSTEDS